MTYSEIVQGAEWDGSTLRAVIPAAWRQGRTVFGGVLAGLALHTMQRHAEADRPLRSALISFVAPVAAGEVALQVEVLRAGRNVTHVEARVMQHEAVCCTVLACFGKGRNMPIRIDSPPMPEGPAPDALAEPPFVPGISPEFANCVAYRWPLDDMPFMGKGDGATDGWVRLREEIASTADVVALLVDAWPSPALAMLTGPAPVSSLTWSLELFRVDERQRADDWWRIRACIDSAAEGYVHEDALMWGPDGQLAARSRQTVSVYAAGK